MASDTDVSDNVLGVFAEKIRALTPLKREAMVRAASLGAQTLRNVQVRLRYREILELQLMMGRRLNAFRL